LGPFARERQPIKSFAFPSQRKEALVSFTFNQNGTWDGNDSYWGPDKFKVYVNNQIVDFGFFGWTHTNFTGSGTTTTTFGNINWRRTYLNGIYPSVRHALRMEIPVQNLSPVGAMTLRFFADVNENVGEFASIDNLSIVSCDQTGLLPG
jgi:hypothetical protein